MIAYVVACVGEFARANELTDREAFRFLETYGGIDFLIGFYDTEHLLSLQDAVEDLMVVSQKAGGRIQ
jgi:hypothetical protein